MRIHITNGKIMGKSGFGDLFVENGIIVDNLSEPADRVIDVNGACILPGLIDAHCHLRDPGYEYREDIISGTKSAAKGGFTSVCPMPNTRPVCDNASVVRSIITKAKLQGYANVFPIGAASKGLAGKELAEYGLMKEEGIVGVSDDGRPIETPDLLMKVLQYASDFSLPVLNHCEDISLSSGVMNEGDISTQLGLRGIPTAAEDIMISRDIILSEYLHIPIHICHVSTKGGVRMIREAKACGVKVTAETCPHYFVLTEDACLGFDTNAKMNPPLRTEEDRLAIIEGLADKTIDMIVTDHAPHHADEKDLEFSLANNGIVGFETAFALGITYLVRPGHLTLNDLVECMSVNPSKLFGLQRGTLTAGAPADIAVFDLENSFVFDKEKMLSKARNTPFDGYTLYGKTLLTMAGGVVTYEELC
jgi:dihydroorotase